MLLEEAYEAFDALEEARVWDGPTICAKSWAIYFSKSRSSPASPRSVANFNIDDVIDEVHAKMVRRHPHVFGDAAASDSAEDAAQLGSNQGGRKTRGG